VFFAGKSNGLRETLCFYHETMTDLNELQIFAQVVQEMSFTRAADALEISKAAVSRGVASLETRLGTRLFERTTRRLRLTEGGETYFAYARRALEEAEDGEAAVSRLSERPRGTLRVVMPVTLAQGSVAPQLARFLQTYPELRLDITLKGGQTDPLAQRVDVVFQTARPESDSQIIQKRIVTVKMGIYASPRYLATAPPLRAPEDLLQHSNLTLTAAREGTNWRVCKDGKFQEIRLRGRVAVGDPVIHHRLCVDGVGVAILPNWLADEDAKKKRLVRVLADWTPSPIELYALYPTRLSMTPKLNVFLKFMEAVVPRT
jgi:LysR family transcriptional regulator, regulator for bpeEF and oprC